MPQNLELKARVTSLSSVRAIARSLGAHTRLVLRQVDTYIQVADGRLKVRRFGDGTGELIYYRRDTKPGSDGRWSSYLRYPVRDPKSVLAELTARFGIRAVVRKRREVFLIRNARIHLDAVSGLGSFFEFEVVQKHGPRQARDLFRQLRHAFGVRDAATIGGSYVDMVSPPLRQKG